MRNVNIAWNTEIPAQQIIEALMVMFTRLRGKPVVLTIGQGQVINGLPEGFIYVEA